MSGFMPSQPCWSRWDRRAGCLSLSKSQCLTQQFLLLIKSKQYKCVHSLPLTPELLKSFFQAPSFSTVETYYCEVVLALDLSLECTPSIFFQICLAGNAVLHSLCVHMSMSKSPFLHGFYNWPLDACFASNFRANTFMFIVGQDAWLVSAALEG